MFLKTHDGKVMVNLDHVASIGMARRHNDTTAVVAAIGHGFYDLYLADTRSEAQAFIDGLYERLEGR